MYYHLVVLSSGRAVAKRDVDSATVSLTSTFSLLEDDACNVSLVTDDVSNGSTVLKVIFIFW